jgi:RNA polymerase sigma factor (sigma-70 family)
MASTELQQFLAVLRNGDQRAVGELLQQVDPYLRRAIHLRLIDGRLRRVMDTMDIFQSLLKDFLSQRDTERAREGASTDLCAYLAAAVHYKIQTRLRKERRYAGRLSDFWEPASPDAHAVQRIEDQDLAEAIRARLTERNRQLFDLRAKGLSWDEIAEGIGGNSDALRMRLNRGVATVLSQLR